MEGRSEAQLAANGEDALRVDVRADGASRLFGRFGTVGVERLEVAASRCLLLDAGLQLLFLLGERSELGGEALELLRDLGVGHERRVLDFIREDLKLGEVAEASCEEREASARARGMRPVSRITVESFGDIAELGTKTIGDLLLGPNLLLEPPRLDLQQLLLLGDRILLQRLL